MKRKGGDGGGGHSSGDNSSLPFVFLYVDGLAYLNQVPMEDQMREEELSEAQVCTPETE